MLLLVVGALVVVGVLAFGAALVPGRVGLVVGDVSWREAWRLAWAARTGRLRGTGRALEDVLRRDRACRLAERWLARHREIGWWSLAGLGLVLLGPFVVDPSRRRAVLAAVVLLVCVVLVPLERRLLESNVRRLRAGPEAS